jgi:hypothetical protein
VLTKLLCQLIPKSLYNVILKSIDSNEYNNFKKFQLKTKKFCQILAEYYTKVIDDSFQTDQRFFLFAN